jgi:phosphoribosyl 1,2-cyclic phosphodiesterase
MPATVFSITYWGITGTLAAPLKPAQASAKLRAALQYLAERKLLDELTRLANDTSSLNDFLERHLPFELRSTYGGNSTCVEVQTADAMLIIDCGTGFRELGIDLERRWGSPGCARPREIHVLITHPHMDHTLATPFFDPYFNPEVTVNLYSSASVLQSLDAVLSPTGNLRQVYFPATYDMFQAEIRKQTIAAGQTFTVGKTTVRTIDLFHPGGCLGFRFDREGRSFVFCTDHEAGGGADQRIADFARGADLLYLDGQYLAAEYEGRAGIMGQVPASRRGWGHATVESCVATAIAADAKQLHLGHREPMRDDENLARVERYALSCITEQMKRSGRDTAACKLAIPFEGLTVQL